jgi:hypothetical protein
MLYKVRNIIRIHQNLEHKVITTQVYNKVAEANSFETPHTLSSDIVPDNGQVPQKQ